jgi:hypothetical protein
MVSTLICLSFLITERNRLHLIVERAEHLEKQHLLRRLEQIKRALWNVHPLTIHPPCFSHTVPVWQLCASSIRRFFKSPVAVGKSSGMSNSSVLFDFICYL